MTQGERSPKFQWDIFDVGSDLGLRFENSIFNLLRTFDILGTVMKSIGKGYKKGGCEHNPPLLKVSARGLAHKSKHFHFIFRAQFPPSMESLFLRSKSLLMMAVLFYLEERFWNPVP